MCKWKMCTYIKSRFYFIKTMVNMFRQKLNPYSAGIDFSRQNLTSVKIFLMAVDP